ncbi:MAG: hypothetical protein R3F17_02545 [Planctomycetota bacterium]
MAEVTDPEAGFRTFYERPVLDRPLGRYTLEWNDAGGTHRLRVPNRLVDLQGHRPSLASTLRLPRTLWTWWSARGGRLLRRPVPFLTWDAVHRLEQCVRPGSTVLEVAGGNSTLWLLERGARVFTLEPDAAWAERLRTAIETRLGPEALARWQVRVTTGERDLQPIREGGGAPWDVAIIDPSGWQIPRLPALYAARAHMAPGGTLVLDNSDHPLQWPASEVLGPPNQVFTGYGAMCLVVTQTSFWQVPSAG